MVDDIGFIGGPYDQTSNVSTNTAEELNRDTNPIRGYYTSVGNQALSHYEEPFAVDSVCLEDGMSRARAQWVYLAVRWFAAKAASIESAQPILRAP